MRISHAGLVIFVGLALAGCQRLNYSERSDLPSQPSQPSSLTPAPVGGVEASQLPPPGGAGAATATGPGAPQTAPGTAPAGGEQKMASLGNGNAAAEIKPESMIGRWTVKTSGSACDLFLSMTKWTGGYRAATRNCSGTAANISAWDVKGGQVVLSDNVGNQVASVRQAGNQSYQGATASGQPLTLGR